MLADTIDPAAWIKEQVNRTPWWLISGAFHGVVLACLTLIGFSAPPPKEAEAVSVAIAPKARPKLEELKSARRDLFDSSGLKRGESVPTDEPVIHHPFAVPGDHNESDNDEEHQQMKGDSFEYLSYLPGQDKGAKGRQPGFGPGHHDAIGLGAGGGGAGPYGGRLGGDRNVFLKDGGGCGVTENAVLVGLKWLARHQGEDGGWHAEAFASECGAGSRCGGDGYTQFDVGLTGLSLLAFLGAGYTHISRGSYEDPYTHEKIAFGKVVKRGIEYLISVQDKEGCFGTRTGEFMYNHAIGALAMAEAYGLTNAVAYRHPAQRGIDFITVAQNPYMGWRYSVKPGDNDTSVTGWCVMALKSAEISGLTTAETCFDGAREWLERVTNKETGEVGYNGLGKVDVIVRGKNEDWSSHPSMTAIGLLCRIYIDKDETDAMLAKHAKLVFNDQPAWDAAKRSVDSYYWYYATLALFLAKDGPCKKYWEGWNDSMKDALLPNQKVHADGCANGSWDPAADRWGFAGGRVYMTAINVLTLEVYYRYESVFGARTRK